MLQFYVHYFSLVAKNNQQRTSDECVDLKLPIQATFVNLLMVKGWEVSVLLFNTSLFRVYIER